MQLTRGVWQMSLAMIISGSIGAFVLLSGLPVTDVVFWRCLIGALTLLVFIVLSRQPFSRLTRFTLALAVIGGAALSVSPAPDSGFPRCNGDEQARIYGRRDSEQS